MIEADRHAAIVRRWVERAWNEADAAARLDALRRLHPAEVLNEGQRTPVEDLAAWHERMRATYPDLHYEIDELVEADGRVTLRWTARGTQRGSLWGLVPPTNRRVSWRGIHLVTVRGDLIVEVWGAADLVGILQQLGVRLLPADPAGE